ncbi:MAG TPA: amidohydrolase [Candidatus Cloacimonetes bacterium]|nr:amidohydrolase [Candidatus Cloacimonadota bacterium]
MDTILYNAKIYAQPAADALLIRDGYIYHVGSFADCKHYARAGVEAVNLAGKNLLPAFTDAHTHFVEYAKHGLYPDLSECSTIDGIINSLKEYRRNMPKGLKWILGGMWDQNRLSDISALNKKLLDAIFPDIPVALWSRDYHNKLCNSQALKIAGFTSDVKDPAGGRFERFPDGELNGILFEKATELIDPYVVQADDSTLITAIKKSVGHVYKYGITGIHSMEYDESITLLRDAFEQGPKLRLCWHFMEQDYEKALQIALKSYEGDEWFKLGGLKLFADGTLGSKSAAIFESYPGEPENRGILRYQDDELFEIAERARKDGFSLTIHAIGDRAVSQSIDCFVALHDPQNSVLNRIEHVQAIRAQDITRLKEYGISVSLQPVHLMADIPQIRDNWQHIGDRAYPIKSIVDAGVGYGFGSDSPIESINPFLGIYAAMERKNYADLSVCALSQDEAITLDEAIFGYTSGAAALSGSENLRGKLQKGFLADMFVLDEFDLRDSDFWLSAKSRLTILDGMTVFSDI